MKISTKEELLLEGASRQQPGVLEEILGRYEKPMYGFLLAACAKTDKELDEVYVKIAAKALKSLSQKSEPSPLLLQFLRLAVKEIQSYPQSEWTPPNPMVFAPIAADEEAQIRLLLCLKVLSNMKILQRVVMLLRDQLQLSFEEMAYVLDQPEAQLKTLLQEARLIFREKMKVSLRAKDFYDLRKH